MNKNYPRTCATCNHRVDGPDAAFKDWEVARQPLEDKLIAIAVTKLTNKQVDFLIVFAMLGGMGIGMLCSR